MFDKINRLNKKGAIGAAITWVVATIVVFFLVIIFLVMTFQLAEKRNLLDFAYAKNIEGGQILAQQSLMALINTSIEEEIIQDSLLNGENKKGEVLKLIRKIPACLNKKNKDVSWNLIYFSTSKGAIFEFKGASDVLFRLDGGLSLSKDSSIKIWEYCGERYIEWI